MDQVIINRELLRHVVDDLMSINPGNMTPMAEEIWLKSTRALIAALEQPAVEPVAWLDVEMQQAYTTDELADATGTGFLPLYAAPQTQQPAEVPMLTDEELYAAFVAAKKGDFVEAFHYWKESLALAVCREIEAAVRKKAGLK